MGIYDREYYRDGSSSFLGSLAARGLAWKWLIALNVVAHVFQRGTAQFGIYGWFTDLCWLDTDKVLHGELWRLLTSAFLHSAGWEHIVVNMFVLWWAGSEVEDIYGSREFTALYLVAAVVSSAAFVIWDVAANPAGAHSRALGASGAVTAVLVLFAMHYPNRTLYLFMVLPVRAIVLVAVYVAWDALGALRLRQGENIGFAAHLGGAAFGFLYYKFQWRVISLWPTGLIRAWKPGRARPKLRVYRGEQEHVLVQSEAPQPSVTDLEAELDAVLAKVARLGKSSLTEHEQQILLRASEIYRQRRK